MRVWDLASGQLERTLKAKPGWVERVAIAPNGKWIISGGGPNERSVRIWNLTSGDLERTIEGPICLELEQVAITSDGRWIVSSWSDSTIHVWDFVSGQDVAYWICDPGHIARTCCTVPIDASLILYGAGGVHLLRLLE